MSGTLAKLGIVAQIALRNLFASAYKTLIVGGIIGFGACLVVLGTSLLDSTDRAMSRSIVGSVAGHIQVYSSKSKHELDVMGGMSFDSDQPEPLDDFEQLRKVLLAVPNVRAVVPMGIDGAIVNSGNTVDQALARLRDSVRALMAKKPSDAQAEGIAGLSGAEALEYQTRKDHVRQILRVLGADIENVRKLESDVQRTNDDLEAMHAATSDEFWQTFDQDPFARLELLENRIAPLTADADMLFLRYVGTDPAAFQQSFDRMRVVDGEAIPAGQRGFMFSKYMYEEIVKLKTARGLDKIRSERQNRHAKIAEKPELQRLVREAATEVKELLLQLDAAKTARFQAKLGAYLKIDEQDVGKLLGQFLTVDDQNFDERYAFFYRELAPDLELYRVRVGDPLTIRAFTRSGYVQSLNLKVYGTYEFEGLEQSPQAGGLNLMDLVSFRELYGFMTADRAQEIAALRAGVGAREVNRADAENLLFGSPTAEATAPVAAGALETALAGLAGGRPERAEVYDVNQLSSGVVLNTAVLLNDDSRLEETRVAIEAAGKSADLPLKAVSWQTASGLTGQFSLLMRAVLYIAVLIIFVVALVIINNALVMATLARVREIGTLRAIGAQRRFVLSMLVLESIVVGLFSGTIGALLGAGIVTVFGRTGIPALNDAFTFFFSGPRLYPELGGQSLLIALLSVLVVSVVSSVYPAWIAMRVSPVQAMAAEE
jgi:ABC-type lipoprotein release transport system permease subunit